jgi:hypothetical protein
LVQSLLASDLESQELPIQVVDIGGLEKAPVLGGNDVATPRTELFGLIKAIANEGPRAIGVDIDFSPDRNGYKNPAEDPFFFRSIAELSSRGPAFPFSSECGGRPISPANGGSVAKNLRTWRRAVWFLGTTAKE